MSTVSEKSVLRKKMKEKRAALTPDAYAARSHMICELLWQMPVVREARRICCYAPLPQEVDLWELIERFFTMGDRQIAFPRVYAQDADSRMDFYEVGSRQELSEGVFHVLEPVGDGRTPVDWEDALVLVPGVAFAADGSRCGYGKGYYDRYFSEHPGLVRIGIAFDVQLTGELPPLCEPTDIRMDYVQTEYRSYAACDAMDYETLVAQISGSRRFGKAPGIVCSEAVCELLGRPQDDLRFVHIAGTNGKGSVAAFLTEICVQAGLRVGCFTSPHLEHFTERIQIGHTQIAPEDVLKFGRVVWRADHRLRVSKGLSLTMFDYCLAIALLYYRQQGVDLVVLETGLGGRLDSTNIIPAPLVSVITEIGLEHTEYLGTTVAQIASEKAGILKAGTQAVLMDQPQEALGVLTERCEALGVPVHISGMVDADGRYRGGSYEIGMPGAYQHRNAAAAIEAAGLLAQTFAQITPQAVCDGVKNARWPGRMELVGERPQVILDGAHNVHGVRALVESLRAWKPQQTYTFFMGVMAEKDYETMIELILPLADRIYTLTPDSSRALSAEALCAMIREKGGQADVCLDEQHLIGLIRARDADEICIVFGSLYLIGAVRKLFLEGKSNIDE